jgi:phosphate transport system substrate-binding protein
MVPGMNAVRFCYQAYDSSSVRTRAAAAQSSPSHGAFPRNGLLGQPFYGWLGDAARPVFPPVSAGLQRIAKGLSAQVCAVSPLKRAGQKYRNASHTSRKTAGLIARLRRGSPVNGAGLSVRILTTTLLLVMPLLGACGEHKTVKADGSSTVAPIMMAAAERFAREHSEVRVTVGISGTGGGFKKFLDPRPDLRTDISDASRPIKKSEIETAAKVGVEFIELPIAMDGMAIMVHPSNDFCDHLTVAELKRIWEPGSAIQNWKDVRAGFRDLPLKLYGAGTDSGTFDYFTEAIVGKEKACRSDYTASENDNTLVQGIAGGPGALGFFGFGYYEANQNKLKLLAIDPGDGTPIKPSLETIRNGSYKPLSRPLFVYANKASVQRPEVRAFIEHFLSSARPMVEHPKVGYVALSDELYAISLDRLRKGITGSVFGGRESVGIKSLADLYRAP